MKTRSTKRTRRVAVTDPITTGSRYDYADAYVAQEPELGAVPPEAWVRAGLAATPGVVDRVVALLGFREQAEPSADRLSVFRIVSSDARTVHLEASVPLMRVVLVGRSVEPGRRMLTTAIHFERPLLARLAWAFVGIGHRLAAPRVVTADAGTA
jgi:hypothetical protein